MADACGPGSDAQDNPGAWLGALLGAAAAVGRDQLTLLTSPGIRYFGLWAEQLIAESTGKEGTGILPVTGGATHRSRRLRRHPPVRGHAALERTRRRL